MDRMFFDYDYDYNEFMASISIAKRIPVGGGCVAKAARMACVMASVRAPRIVSWWRQFFLTFSSGAGLGPPSKKYSDVPMASATHCAYAATLSESSPLKVMQV